MDNKNKRFEMRLCFPAKVCGARFAIHDMLKDERVVTVLDDQVKYERVQKWVDFLNSLDAEDVGSMINEINERLNASVR